MKDFFRFLFSKDFLKQLLFIILFFVLVFFLVFLWLKAYTNHGQKLILPSYIDQRLEEARDAAEDDTFEIVVTDSIHVVDKPGGIILSQNPKAGSEVKENRKIYVTTTKYKADTYLLSELPQLYGNEYDQRKQDLKRFEINSRVKARQYDPGEPNYILEVYYEGEKIVGQTFAKEDIKIDKGATLDFIVSDRSGGTILIPNLICQEFSAAEFLLKAGNKLKLGSVRELGAITNRNTSFIVDQSPRSDGVTEIEMGEAINITISQERPASCQ